MTSIHNSPAEWRFAAVAALLLAAVVAAYLPLRHNDFVNFDDERLILDNPVLRNLSLGALGDLLERQLFTPHYKPLVNLSWAAELRLFGPNPRAFHRHNLLLHLLNALLVLALATRLAPAGRAWQTRLGGAAAVAAIWALHPMKVESVAWAAERKDVLFASFYLGAMLTYLRYVDARRRRWLALSAMLALGGVLSKSTAVTLPVALPLIDLVRGRRLCGALLIEKLPHLGVAFLALYLYGLVPGPGEAGTSLALLAGPDPLARLTATAHRHLAFATRWVAPTGLAVLYPVPEFLHRPGWGRLAAYALAHLALVAGVASIIRRSPRVAAAALFFFSLTLLPTLVTPVSITNYLSDRYTYLPSLGLAVLAVLAAATLHRRWRRLGPVLVAAGILVTAALGLLTYRLTGVWRTSLRLWDHTLAVQPPHPYAYNNRGVARLRKGNADGALADFDRALRAMPDYAAALANRGDLLRRRGRATEAIADLDRAVSLEPAHGRLYRVRGLANLALGRPADAIADYTQALQLDPADGEILYLRAQAHLRASNPVAARSDIDRALAEFPAPSTDAYLLRSLLRAAAGDLRGALDDTTRAANLEPASAVAFNNRGFLRLQLDDPNGALADLDRALLLRPAYPLAQRNRGDALAALGRHDAACAAWQAARAGGAPDTLPRLTACPPPAESAPVSRP